MRGPAKLKRANLSLVDIDFDFIERMLPLPDEDAFGSTESTTIKRSGPTSYLQYRSTSKFPRKMTQVQGRTTREPAQDQLETTRRTRRTRTTPWSTQKPRGSSEDSHWRHCLPLRDARRSGVRQSTSTAQSRSGHSTASVPSTLRADSIGEAGGRAKRAAEETAAAAPGKTPADIMMSNLGDAAKGSGRPSARPLAPSIPRGDFTPAQVAALHKTIHDHVQLLLQTYARTAWNQTPEAQLVARRTRGLIEQLVQDTKHRLMLKVQSKAPPYRRSGSRARTMRRKRCRKTTRRQKLA